MSNESKNFTLEEKTKIALEASSGSIEETAEKYGVEPQQVNEWIRETGVGTVSIAAEEDEELTLESSQEFGKGFDAGVTPDTLNFGRLTFWSVFGSAVILLMIISIYFVYDYSFQAIDQQRSSESIYYDISDLKERERVKLDSFGVVSLDDGIYHMPIDSAIARIATDSE